MGILGVPAVRMMPFSQKEFSRRDAVVRLQHQMCSASVRRRKSFCRRKATRRSSWSCGSSSHCTVRGFCVRTPKERATSPKEKVSESETVATFLITKLGRRRLMNKKNWKILRVKAKIILVILKNNLHHLWKSFRSIFPPSSVTTAMLLLRVKIWPRKSNSNLTQLIIQYSMVPISAIRQVLLQWVEHSSLQYYRSCQ